VIFNRMDDAAINNLQSGCGTQSDLKQKPKEASMQLDRVCEFGNRVVYAVVHYCQDAAFCFSRSNALLTII
jgi:hypothetical protein